MAFDEALADRIRAALAGDADVSEKRMFGGLAFLYRGHMFAGVSGARLMARVGKDQQADSLGRPHVREMDFTGRPLAGYVYIESAGLADITALAFWLERCRQHVGTLPAKGQKAPRAPARSGKQR